MKKIRVLYGGCGIEYKDAKGNARHALKTAEDGPFECDDEQADHFVKKGVAAYVEEEKAAQHEGTEGTDETSQKLHGHLDAADLEAMDYNELKKLAADLGVKPDGQKKADYIAAIVAVEVEVDAEDAVFGEGEPDAEEDPDELPELSAADPE